MLKLHATFKTGLLLDKRSRNKAWLLAQNQLLFHGTTMPTMEKWEVSSVTLWLPKENLTLAAMMVNPEATVVITTQAAMIINLQAAMMINLQAAMMINLQAAVMVKSQQKDVLLTLMVPLSNVTGPKWPLQLAQNQVRTLPCLNLVDQPRTWKWWFFCSETIFFFEEIG